jgi:carbon starvation protein
MVIISIGAGIGLGLNLADGTVLHGVGAWNHYYGSWIGDKGLADKIAPVIQGAANLVATTGIPAAFGVTVMGVFIASFAGTSLDTAVRLQRYVVGELANDIGVPRLSNRWASTTFAVLTAALLAFASGTDGTGAMRLWPLFGGANQLLAALALLVVTLYLRHRGGLKYLVTGLPCLFMLVVTNWAMVENEMRYISSGNWILASIGGLIFVFALWMTVEAIIAFIQVPRVIPSPTKVPAT